MTRPSLRQIITRADEPTRKKLVLRELRLLGIVLGIWVIVLTSNAVIHQLSGGFSWLTAGLDGAGASRLSSILPLLLIFGPPVLVIFRLILFRSVLAGRVVTLLDDEHRIKPEETVALRSYLAKRMGFVVLMVLLAIFVLVIVFSVIP